MAVACPYCGQQFKLPAVKPGRYRPTCKKCGQRFHLEVPADSQAAVVTKAEIAPAAPPADAAAHAKTAADPSPRRSDTVVEQTAIGGASKTQVAVADVTVAMSGPTPVEPSASQARTVMAGIEQTAVSGVTPATADHNGMPERLGGYRVIKELGRGAMGAVYLAKQISLDRLVALKVIQTRLASNPTFLARFTREAYAAAQLVHHNVVQIYDLGREGDVNFFSMEYVQGQALDKLLREHGPVEAKIAAGYILQAARGLAFAHNQGMVHRDVKPANLMLNDQGVVKVADLGLVKTPEPDLADLDFATLQEPETSSLTSARATVTALNSIIGTPAYMAPEQARNASKVDHRADIYSLGCTLYALLTGCAPFDGSIAQVIKRHQTEAFSWPAERSNAVPRPLLEIVQKMTAKSPEERFSTAQEVAAALEHFLSDAGATVAPGPAEAALLEEGLAEFNRAPAARLRKLLVLAFSTGGAVLCVASLWVSLALAAGLGALLLSAIATYFVISGLRQRTHLFEKVRQFVFQSSWGDRATWLGGGMLILLLAYLTGTLVACVAGAVLGAVAGATLHFWLDRRVEAERRGSLDRLEAMLKALRLRGVDEQSLRQFVAKFSGDEWEELFETLFGFEARRAARKHREDEGLKPGRRFRSWRDAIVDRLDARLKAYEARRTQSHLERVEQEGLKAEGVAPDAARDQAKRLAAALVGQSAPTGISREELSSDPTAAATAKRARIKAMLAEARGGKEAPQRRTFEVLNQWLNLFLGARVRFLLGCGLMLGFVLWLRQNGVLSGGELQQAATEALQNQQVNELAGLKVNIGETEPLAIPLIGRLFDSLNPGLAGLVLIFSALFRGWKMSLFVLPAAFVAVFGPTLGVPGIAMLGGSYATSAALALALATVGLLLGRSASP